MRFGFGSGRGTIDQVLFSSITFLFFFLPAAVVLYFLAPTALLKSLVLLTLSLLFYAWGEPVFMPVLAGVVLVNFVAAVLMDPLTGPARTVVLAITLVVDLGLLGLFKYADFAVLTLARATQPFHVRLLAPGIPLPLGISFFTFHCLSYLIDVYRRRFPANRRLWEVGLYIALFPQLVAGPIVRYKTIAGQLRQRRHSLGRSSAGLRMFVIGLAQKVLIADVAAPLSGAVFDHTVHPGLADAWLGTLAYTLQIYFDFAGYSNMAIGLGLVFGFSLPRNFNLPYRSRSITEFWRRWHITLSSWFRDYLYIPIGGNRGSALSTYRNLVIVFLLCGLWHGASWTFVLWGAWHGAFLVIERAGLSKRLASLPLALSWAYAALAVMFGWALFRAPDLAEALDVWRGMVGLNGAGGFGPALAAALQPAEAVILGLGAILAFTPPGRRRAGAKTVQTTDRGGLGPAHRPAPSTHALAALEDPTARSSGVLRPMTDWSAIAAMLGLSILQISGGAYSPFLYFRF
jgi:D-alanyl-lipoteichoic acid acyltransferase DltB (MBOAT superfamily)